MVSPCHQARKSRFRLLLGFYKEDTFPFHQVGRFTNRHFTAQNPTAIFLMMSASNASVKNGLDLDGLKQRLFLISQVTGLQSSEWGVA